MKGAPVNTAPGQKQKYSWAVCEVEWFAVMQEDGSFEHHDWEGIVFLKSNDEGNTGSLRQLQKGENLDISDILQSWTGGSREQAYEGDETGDTQIYFSEEVIAR